MDQGTSELSPQAIGETVDIIEEEIGAAEITPQNAPSFALQYLRWTIKGLEHILGETPNGLPVLRDYVEFLKESLGEGEHGEFTDVARFIRSEGEKNRNSSQEPEWVKRDILGQKLTKIADTIVSKQAPPQS